MARSAATKAKPVLTYLLGKCLPGLKENAARIRVNRLELDKNLHMYFSEFEFVYAHDPAKICKPGDIVLIQNLPEKITRLITHKVIDVIYPLGDMIDPITGKKVVQGIYRDNMDEINKLYGDRKDGFDYNKALPRGRLKNIRDFSHEETYLKWYDDPNDPQPFAV